MNGRMYVPPPVGPNVPATLSSPPEPTVSEFKIRSRALDALALTTDITQMPIQDVQRRLWQFENYLREGLTHPE